jgi:hypothetical protein
MIPNRLFSDERLEATGESEADALAAGPAGRRELKATNAFGVARRPGLPLSIQMCPNDDPDGSEAGGGDSRAEHDRPDGRRLFPRSETRPR